MIDPDKALSALEQDKEERRSKLEREMIMIENEIQQMKKQIKSKEKKLNFFFERLDVVKSKIEKLK